MTYDPFFAHIAPFGPLTDEDRDALRALIIYHELPQHHLLEQAGQVGRHYYFILKGASRAYLLDEAGTETTFRFSFENTFEGSFDSLRTGEPASAYIELLEPSRLLSIQSSQFAGLLLTNPNLARIAEKISAYWIGRLADRLIRFRTMSATQKYERIQQEYPGIVNRVSLSYIASYLGLSLETLSRIRAKRL